MVSSLHHENIIKFVDAVKKIEEIEDKFCCSFRLLIFMEWMAVSKMLEN